VDGQALLLLLLLLLGWLMHLTLLPSRVLLLQRNGSSSWKSRSLLGKPKDRHHSSG
jgi:hypothetical protein